MLHRSAKRHAAERERWYEARMTEALRRHRFEEAAWLVRSAAADCGRCFADRLYLQIVQKTVEESIRAEHGPGSAG